MSSSQAGGLSQPGGPSRGGQRRKGRELSPQELTRTVLPEPEVRLLERQAAAVRVVEVTAGLARVPWQGPLRKVQPVTPITAMNPGIQRPRPAPAFPGSPLPCQPASRPGVLPPRHPMEAAVSADASPDEAIPADPSPVHGDAGLDAGLEVMDTQWSYALEDPRDPRLTSGEVRLTEGGEDTASAILFDRIEAHEQAIAWHRAQVYVLLAHAAQLPVPPPVAGRSQGRSTSPPTTARSLNWPHCCTCPATGPTASWTPP